MTRLLAFDSSTDTLSIALQLPQGLSVRESAGGAQASARLLPDIQALLADAGCTLAQLDAIAYGCGPGAFTGLRTACAAVQGLAFGARLPVVPVDSLMLVAEDAREQLGDDAPGTVWVAMDARMDEIYAGAYRWQGDRWAVASTPALYTPDALNAAWQTAPPAAVAGSALIAFAERLDTDDALRVPDARSRATALARVAAQRWSEGAVVDAAHALPVYLRDKVAHTTAEREAIRRAKEQAA